MIIGKQNQSILLHNKKSASKLIRLDAISITKRMRSYQECVVMKEGDLIVGVTQLTDDIKMFS